MEYRVGNTLGPTNHHNFVSSSTFVALWMDVGHVPYIGEENIHYLAILQCLQEASFSRLQVSINPLPNTACAYAVMRLSTLYQFVSL